MKQFISKNEKETRDLAFRLAKTLKAGDILALKGELGSGKTTFTKSLAEALGVKEVVTSPTYVVAKSYPFVSADRELKFVHIDAYRLSGVEDAISIGLEELLKEDNIIVVEWPEKVWPLIEKRARVLSFEYLDDNGRRITL